MQINIGYDNFIQSDLLAVVVKYDSSPVKKLCKYATEKKTLASATSGHKTRSAIVLQTNQIVLSSLQSTTLKSRVEKKSDSNIALINIGHQNFLRSSLITSILVPDSLHTKKLRQDAAEKGMLINATCGSKTRSVILLTSGQIILSSLQTTTIKDRAEEDPSKIKFINIGYDNFLQRNLISVTMIPDTSDARRLRLGAVKKGVLSNATCGRKTRSIMLLTTGQVVLSSLQTTTIKHRTDKKLSKIQEYEDQSSFDLHIENISENI